MLTVIYRVKKSLRFMLFFVALVCVEKPRFTKTLYRFSGCGARIIFPQFDTIIFSGYETLPEFTTRPDFLQRALFYL
jgi:hypothetical protein